MKIFKQQFAVFSNDGVKLGVVNIVSKHEPLKSNDPYPLKLAQRVYGDVRSVECTITSESGR